MSFHIPIERSRREQLIGEVFATRIRKPQSRGFTFFVLFFLLSRTEAHVLALHPHTCTPLCQHVPQEHLLPICDVVRWDVTGCVGTSILVTLTLMFDMSAAISL